MRGSGIARPRRRDRAGGRRGDPRVPARSERGACRAASGGSSRSRCGSTSSTLEAHALLDFSGVLERAVQLLKDMDEFAAEPLPARGALSPRARRRVPGHQPRAVGARRAAREELGRRLRRRRRRDPAVDLHRRRPEAVDLRLPRRRRGGGRRSGRRSSTALRPDGSDPRQAISVSFRSAPEILAFVNDVFAGSSTRRPMRARRVPVRRDRSVSDRATAGCAGRPEAATSATASRTVCASASPRADDDAPSASSSATPSPKRPTRRPTKSSRLLGTRPCAIATTGVRACGAARPTSRSCFARATAIASSRRRSSAAACRPTSTKGSGFFDADEIQDAVALLRYLADPLSDLRAAAFLRSRIVRLSDAASRASRQTSGRRDRSARSAPSRWRSSGRRGPSRARAAARARCRAGCRGSIG